MILNEKKKILYFFVFFLESVNTFKAVLTSYFQKISQISKSLGRFDQNISKDDKNQKCFHKKLRKKKFKFFIARF